MLQDLPRWKNPWRTYSKLKDDYLDLKEQVSVMMEAMALGFASLPDTVRSGAARQIYILTDKYNGVTEDEK